MFTMNSATEFLLQTFYFILLYVCNVLLKAQTIRPRMFCYNCPICYFAFCVYAAY